jgi:hypothetical protein
VRRLTATGRNNGYVLTARVLLLGLSVAMLATACGGSGSSSSSGGGGGGGGGRTLVAGVKNTDVQINGPNVTASANIEVGGVPKKKVTLEWGLIDASLGQESQQEKVVHRYMTTSDVVDDTQKVTFRRPVANKPFLVHFVLYGPDGTYLASRDTDEFQTTR